MSGEPIVVIGVGPRRDLSNEALDYIACAEVLAGGSRNLGYFADWQGERLEINANLPQVIERLKERSQERRCVVLASGDPLFYGIGKTLLEHFPRESLLFLPHVSSVQLAFARLKMSWEDAAIVSVHGRALEQLKPALTQRAAKIALLTDRRNHPAVIAEFLKDEGCERDYDIWVGENLGCADERCGFWSETDIAHQDLSPLNVVILIRKQPASEIRNAPLPAAVFGLPEDAFAHRNGQITRWEVRLLALAQLELRPGQVFWDVGAGSGSLAIEAARLCPSLSIWAIEKDGQARGHIRANIDRFGVSGMQVIEGEAPAAFAKLPGPDAVFVGGSSGRLADILETVMTRLSSGGRLVLNCVVLDSLTLAWNWLSERRLRPEATSVQLARSRPLGELTCLEPEKPIFILRVRKP